MSPDIHLGHALGVIGDESAALDKTSSFGTVNFGDLPASQDADALHGLDDGDVLFSLETSMMLGGTLFRPNDVIRFDGANWTMELDGSAEGIPDGVNIDAVAADNGALMISIDTDAVLDGTAMNDSDVISFSDGVFTVHLSSSSAGIEAAADVDALHVDEQGHVQMSFKTGGSLGGIHYHDEDVLSYATPSWTMAFDGSANDLAWIPTDLDAWSSVTVLSLIFRDGFEQKIDF